VALASDDVTTGGYVSIVKKEQGVALVIMLQRVLVCIKSPVYESIVRSI
jgi:hypothetical protein